MAEEPYIHQAYPKHKYHPNGALAVVASPQEEASLGEGWYDSPADYGVETCPAMPLVTTGGFQAAGYQAPATYQAPVEPGMPVYPVSEPIPQEAIAEVQRLEEEAAQRRRGRPPGSQAPATYQAPVEPGMPVYPVSEPIPQEAIAEVQRLEEEAAQRRRGRPPGSRTTTSDPSGESHE